MYMQCLGLDCEMLLLHTISPLLSRGPHCVPPVWSHRGTDCQGTLKSQTQSVHVPHCLCHHWILQ